MLDPYLLDDCELLSIAYNYRMTMRKNSTLPIVSGALLVTIMAGLPFSLNAQTQVPTTSTPGVVLAGDASVPRILPERIALIPSISPFTQAQKPGDKGEGVRNLQRFLNQHGFIVAEAGIGSPGQESDYYGPLTKTAVMGYQKAYAAYVLVPTGTTDASGVFGSQSLAYANRLMGYHFVNLFPVEDPKNSMNGQLASIGSVEIPEGTFSSIIAKLKQQAENIKNLLPSLSE